jgi:G6PDH family F420-dependent oxidoreductase
MREHWTGKVVSPSGEHYSLDTAAIYTLPDQPPPVYVSAFGPKALEVAARIGDGFITTQPDGESVAEFRRLKGDDRAPAMAGLKVAFADSAEEGRDHAHRLWANSGLPGELAQVLPSPKHFEQASTLVTKEATGESVVCGNDAQEHRDAFTPYAEAGFDEVFVANMGPHWREMIEFYGEHVLPQVR